MYEKMDEKTVELSNKGKWRRIEYTNLRPDENWTEEEVKKLCEKYNLDYEWVIKKLNEMYKK